MVHKFTKAPNVFTCPLGVISLVTNVSSVATFVWTGFERFNRSSLDALSTVSWDKATNFFTSRIGPCTLIVGTYNRSGGNWTVTISSEWAMYSRNCWMSNGPPNIRNVVRGGAGVSSRSLYIVRYRSAKSACRVHRPISCKEGSV